MRKIIGWICLIIVGLALCGVVVWRVGFGGALIVFSITAVVVSLVLLGVFLINE